MNLKNYKKLMAGGAALAAVASITGVALAAGNAKVCFEAESASSLESPLRKALPGANKKQYSGRGYIDIPWDQNKTKGIGKATYRVNAKTAGTYYLWARTFWANGCGNSVGISVNGGSEKILGEDGTYDKWHWVGGTARVALKAGVNNIVLHNRETGVRVDQIFLCQDGDYTPTNIRPITK
jgi:hypothetical protein